jgi:tRNA threonylcarbamoyladenosine modification (KEOPS) complex Cgi121 subunit
MADRKRVNAWAGKFSAEDDPEVVKSNARRENPGGLVQTTRKIVRNEFFYELVAAQTIAANGRGSMLAKKQEIDFLLRIAGTAQIADAIRLAGSKRGLPFVLVVASTGGISGLQEHASKRFERRDLTESQLDLVERAALLNAERA